MHPHSGAQAYLRTGIQSASPLQLVVALYEGAIRSTTAAQAAMAMRDIRARQGAIGRTIDIIAELQNTLNLERGGKIAADLDALYTFLLSRLADVTARQDPAPLDEVRRILETLRDAWQQIALQPAGAAAGHQS